MIGRAAHLTPEERRRLENLEAELDAERETEYRRAKSERFGAPVQPFLETRCLNCGGSLIPNSGGFLVHQGHPSCSTPTVYVREA